MVAEFESVIKIKKFKLGLNMAHSTSFSFFGNKYISEIVTMVGFSSMVFEVSENGNDMK